jgi:hypothetical protein
MPVYWHRLRFTDDAPRRLARHLCKHEVERHNGAPASSGIQSGSHRVRQANRLGEPGLVFGELPAREALGG